MRPEITYLDPNYGKHYRELYENHWWWRAREAILIDELLQRMPKKQDLSILDVGCGDALFFDHLRQLGNVEGVESDPELVDPRGPDRSRITVAPFDSSFQPGKHYDLVLMLDVLEHLDAPEEALRHGLSLLKPGGIMVITVPAFMVLWTRHDCLNKHRTRFTKQSFGRLVKSSGMRVLVSRYFFVWLSAAKLATRIVEAIFSAKPSVPKIPPPFINGLLYRISRGEEKLFRKLWVPIGSSLLVVGTLASETR
jgi:2-polyprenyl-3-methyl-5-hydroxy-6-metoxy-1,4-benzoquinol methylase